MDSEKARIVLVAAKEDLLNNLRDALGDTDLALLHAPSPYEAIALLERLNSKIDLAIVDLELPGLGGWDLIRQLTWHPQKPVRIIATTSVYWIPFFGEASKLGVDAVVRAARPPEAWRKTVEAVLVNEAAA